MQYTIHVTWYDLDSNAAWHDVMNLEFEDRIVLGSQNVLYDHMNLIDDRIAKKAPHYKRWSMHVRIDVGGVLQHQEYRNYVYSNIPMREDGFLKTLEKGDKFQIMKGFQAETERRWAEANRLVDEKMGDDA